MLYSSDRVATSHSRPFLSHRRPGLPVPYPASSHACHTRPAMLSTGETRDTLSGSERRQDTTREESNMNQFVMVIDDSLVIRKIVETCLHRAGYEVKSFPDGVEALCWLNTTEAHIPDLVVVDVGLPKLDGYQIIQQIKMRPALEHTKLVILSRRDGILDRLKGRLVGAH